MSVAEAAAALFLGMVVIVLVAVHVITYVITRRAFTDTERDAERADLRAALASMRRSLDATQATAVRYRNERNAMRAELAELRGRELASEETGREAKCWRVFRASTHAMPMKQFDPETLERVKLAVDAALDAHHTRRRDGAVPMPTTGRPVGFLPPFKL